MQLFFIFATLFVDSSAHVLSDKPGQQHLAFMQSQEPDVVVVHHKKRTTSSVPQAVPHKGAVVHHVKPSKTSAPANQLHQSLPSGPDPLSTGAWGKMRGGLWLASRVCIVLAVIGIGVAIGFWRFGNFKNQTSAELISEMPTVSSTAEMQVGAWVKVVGTVGLVDEDAPLRSILEGRSCVFNESRADVPETGVTVARFEATCDLQIVSDSGDLGPVLVHAADSAVLVPKPVLDAMYVRKLMPPDFEDFVKSCPTPGHSGDESLALHALQFQERILEVNARVAIVGVVSISPSGKLCLVPDTVAHLQKTQGCRKAFRRHMQSLLSFADAQFMSSHVVVVDAKKTEDSEQ